MSDELINLRDEVRRLREACSALREVVIYAREKNDRLKYSGRKDSELHGKFREALKATAHLHEWRNK